MSYSRVNIILSGIFGNILEQYDIIIFGFMAHYIANAFFPPSNEITRLFSAFYIFLIGYATRPIGGLFFGFLSDYLGRKRTLIFSILLMGIATAVIGALPTYATIGSAATLLLLLCRILQGLAVGGEYITSIAFLVEHSPPNRMGFMGSWAAVGVNTGNLIASLLSFTTIYAITHLLLPGWTWRLVFLITLIGAVLGLWIRTKSNETLPFIRENSSETIHFGRSHWSSVLQTLKTKKKESFFIIVLTSLGTCVTYLIYLYAPLHAAIFNHSSRWQVFGINAISITVLILLIPFFGHLSDKIGRKKLLLFSSVMFLIFAYPLFWAASYGSLGMFLAIQIMLSIGVASFHSIAPVVIVEIMPVKVRCTMSGFLYGIAASLFGASSPIIALTLVKYTHNYLSPSYYLISFSIIGVISIMSLLHEPIRKQAALFYAGNPDNSGRR